MKIKDRIKNMLIDSKESFKNYPVTIIGLIALFISFVVNTEMRETDLSLNIMKILTLFIPISLTVRVIAKDRFKNDKIKELLMYGVSVLFLFIYYNLFLKSARGIETIRLIGFNLIFYLVFFYINKVKDERFTDYVIGRIGKIMIAGIYSLVLYLGIVFILFTLNNLFMLDLTYKFYLYSFAFIGLVFFPILVLSRFTEEYDEDYNYPKAFRGLLTYIVIPLSLIYITILYAYFIKVILTRTMPEGLVSHLVLWYSIIVVGIHFFIKPLIEDNEYLKKYSKFMPIVILPILLMMFVSMGIRINAYGVTENRYFVMALGIWILISNIYIILKRDYKTRFIPVVLSIMILISIAGPLSAFNISFKSQAKRLDSVLVANNMLVDGKLKKNSDLTGDKKVEISSILNYLVRNHSTKNIAYLENDFSLEDMNRDFGFEYMAYNYGGSNYVSMSLDRNSIIEIDGYDYLVELENAGSEDKKIDGLEIKYHSDSNIVEIFENGQKIYTKDMVDLTKEIYEKNKSKGENFTYLDIDSLKYLDENDHIKTKFIFEELLFAEGEEDFLNVVRFKLLFSLK